MTPEEIAAKSDQELVALIAHAMALLGGQPTADHFNLLKALSAECAARGARRRLN